MPTRFHCDKCDDVIPMNEIVRDIGEIELETPDGEIFTFRFWLRGVMFKKKDTHNPGKHLTMSLCKKCLSDFALRYSIMMKEEKSNE